MQHSTKQIMAFAPQPVRACLVLILAILLAACTQEPENTGSEHAAVEAADRALTLTQWLDEQYETELQFSPIELTFWAQRTQRRDRRVYFSAFAEQLAWKTASVEQMQQLFDREQLTGDEQLSYDLWAYQLERMQQSEPFFYDGLVFDQMNGVQNFVPTFLINFHRVENAQDMAAYIERVKAVKPRMQKAIANAVRAAQRRDITFFALDGTITQARKVITGKPFDSNAEQDSDLWADMRQKCRHYWRQAPSIRALPSNSPRRRRMPNQLPSTRIRRHYSVGREHKRPCS